MKVFLLCLIFVGANAGFLDSLQRGLTNVKERLASEVSAILSPLLGEKLGNFLGHKFVEVAEGVVINSVGKRAVPHKVTIKNVLHTGAKALEQMCDNYATELQHFNEEIASLAYLKGDVHQFFGDMQHSKQVHDKELDNIVSSVKRTLSCDKRKAVDNIIFFRACVQFISAANKLKERFSDVHDRLVGGSKDIVEAVNDHLILLNDTLGHKGH